MNPHDDPRDQQQSRRPQLPLKVMACCAGGILLSFGLCGGNLINGERATVGIAIPSLARAGVILFWLSILTFIGAFLWLIVAASSTGSGGNARRECLNPKTINRPHHPPS